MSPPLVVLDADVLGRRRTGDETYVASLLRALPGAAPDLRLAAVTRRPDLVPPGVEPVELAARSQEWRMAWSLPRLLRRLSPALLHTQHALPLAAPCPAVVTVHDLSFERDPQLMGRLDRAVFRLVVPRAARAARRVIAVSERTRRDLLELYGIPEGKIVVVPHGVDPIFAPDGSPGGGYALLVGAVQARKDPLAAAEAAAAAGLPLVAVGPVKNERLAGELRARGVEVRGYVEQDELVALLRGAACLLMPSRYEGFGLPLLEAMACGTPVVAVREPALEEVAGGAAVFTTPGRLAEGIGRALAERASLVAAGLERARAFSWAAAARRTADVYREALG